MGIHEGFLHFPYFELGQKSWLSLLAKLCGIAINYSCQVSSRLDSPFGSFWRLADYLYSTKGGYSFLLIAKAFWNHQPGWWFSLSSQWGCCKNEFCNSPWRSAVKRRLRLAGPNSGSFPPAVRHFLLQYTKYSREKMASSGGKSLAVGHIPGFYTISWLKSLILIRKASPNGAAGFVIYKERNHKTSLIWTSCPSGN